MASPDNFLSNVKSRRMGADVKLIESSVDIDKVSMPEANKTFTLINKSLSMKLKIIFPLLLFTELTFSSLECFIFDRVMQC